MSVAGVLVILIIIFLIFRVLGRESDIHVTVKRCKALEGRLVRELSATGNGLKEKADSVKDKLPLETYNQIKNEINLERNKIVHEDTHDRLKDRQRFIRSCESVEHSLDELKAAEQSDSILGCLVVLFVIAIAASYFLSQNPL